MLTIRALRPEDLPSLLEIERASSAAAHWRKREYQNLLASDSTPLRKAFVAEKDGHTVGFVIAKAVANDWEIENVIVRAGSQRQGIGERLLSHMIQEAKSSDAQRILLEVRSQNAAAKRLYAKCGFCVVGGRRAYYRDPNDDAVLYKLDLSKREGSICDQ